MARGFNKVVLMGNLTRDPELRSTPSGQQVASFSLAINRSWKNASGEQQEAVDYIDCNAWGKPAEIITQYMHKGSAILISGRLQQRSWEQEGQKRSKVEVVVEDFNFVGGGDSTQSNYNPSTSEEPTVSEKAPPKKTDAKKQEAADDFGNEPINLDDIPF
jgi:single-strand DNA-binding protein